MAASLGRDCLGASALGRGHALFRCRIPGIGGLGPPRFSNPPLPELLSPARECRVGDYRIGASPSRDPADRHLTMRDLAPPQSRGSQAVLPPSAPRSPAISAAPNTRRPGLASPATILSEPPDLALSDQRETCAFLLPLAKVSDHSGPCGIRMSQEHITGSTDDLARPAYHRANPVSGNWGPQSNREVTRENPRNRATPVSRASLLLMAH